MSRRPVQREDILSYCSTQGVTLEQLGNYLVASLATGVPAEQMPFYARCHFLVSAMLDEKAARILAEHYVTTPNCPHCGTPPTPTGGKHPVIYCRNCGAIRLDTRWNGAIPHHRWSAPKRSVNHAITISQISQVTQTTEET